MEQSIEFLDFETVDQMVQIHGASVSACPAIYHGVIIITIDALFPAAPCPQQTTRA